MKKKEFCPHCGQSIMKHRQALTKGLVGILLKVANYHKTEFHLQKDVSLTKNEYTNFQKLKFWGLVKKSDKISGAWSITGIGYKFLMNEIDLPYSVYTFNNRVVEQDSEKVFYKDTGVGIVYSTRPDYVRDMRPMEGVREESLFD